MERDVRPMSRRVETVRSQSVGDEYRHVIFSPTTTGNSLQKLAYLDVPPGIAGVAHVHLGEEVIFTLKGTLLLTIDGSEHLLTAGTALLVPPDVPHLAHVVGDENWISVSRHAAVIDEVERDCRRAPW